MKYLKSMMKKLAAADFVFYLLPLLMALLVAGTVAQDAMGLYRAKAMFFSSYVIWAGPVPLPGGYMLTGLLAVGLALKFLFYSEWSRRKAGIILAHLGALVMLFGGLVTAMSAQEGFMLIGEGDESPYVYDYHRRELFVFEGDRLVERYDFDGMKEGTALDGIPFAVRVAGKCRNCAIGKREDGEGFEGMAQFMALSSKAEEREPEQNLSGLDLEIGGVEGAGRYIAFEGMPKPIEILEGEQTYKIMFGKQQRLLPFRVGLADFVRQVYPGTEKPRDYHSDIVIKDGDVEWPVRVGMNEPLRYKGYTFYQSSFQDDGGTEASILAVVENKGVVFPYIGALIIGIGLLVHSVIAVRRGRA